VLGGGSWEKLGGGFCVVLVDFSVFAMGGAFCEESAVSSSGVPLKNAIRTSQATPTTTTSTPAPMPPHAASGRPRFRSE
jgi:hypothetical protein